MEGVKEGKRGKVKEVEREKVKRRREGKSEG